MRILTSLEGSSTPLFTGNIKISTLGAFGVENLYVGDEVTMNFPSPEILIRFYQEEESGPEAEFETRAGPGPGADGGYNTTSAASADIEEDSLSVKSF